MSEKINEEEEGKKPIIKNAFWKMKEAWYRLSPEARVEMVDKIFTKHGELGAKNLTPNCMCYWSCEEWTLFTVIEYPNIEALQEFEKYLFEIGWQRYVESKIYTGTPASAEELMEMAVKNY